MKFMRHHRKRFTFTFPNGASGPGLIQSVSLPYEGELLWIHQRNGANTNNQTAQLTLEDNDGYQIFDGGAKAANGVYNHEFGVTIRRILSGGNILKCTISGDPGSGGYVIEAVVYFIGIDG